MEAAPKVRAEPNVSPVRRLTTPVPAMDIVMIGRSAYFSDISRVADSSVLQAQRQNYDYFIHTMAEMMKKYAPEILK